MPISKQLEDKYLMFILLNLHFAAFGQINVKEKWATSQ